MPSHEIALSTIHFKSKKDAKAYFTEMLGRYQDEQRVNKSDSSHLFELLQRHPEAEEKIGPGIKYFYRDRSPDHPTPCFHVERLDGSKTDFSFGACVDGVQPTVDQQFYSACRYSVARDLTEQKAKLFERAGGILTCARTGEQITIDQAEYRHTAPKFSDIVSGFIQSYRIEVSDELLTTSDDLQYVVSLRDSGMATAFREHHKSVAALSMFKKFNR